MLAHVHIISCITHSLPNVFVHKIALIPLKVRILAAVSGINAILFLKERVFTYSAFLVQKAMRIR